MDSAHKTATRNEAEKQIIYDHVTTQPENPGDGRELVASDKDVTYFGRTRLVTYMKDGSVDVFFPDSGSETPVQATFTEEGTLVSINGKSPEVDSWVFDDIEVLRAVRDDSSPLPEIKTYKQKILQAFARDDKN